MLNPISLTNASFNYLGKTPQQLRPQDQAPTIGREQTQAPAADPQSLSRMLPVTGKQEAEGNVRINKEKPQQEQECQTCKNRKYQDGSDDPGVSFKTAGKIDPDAAPSVVRSHEQEHVTRERAKASREGREVVSQSVTLHTAVCPECGRVYVSGGTTRTVTRGADEPKKDDEIQAKGRKENTRTFSAWA